MLRKSLKSKRGELSAVTQMIIILACAIVIFGVIYKFTNKSTLPSAVDTCRLSVVAQVVSEFKLTLSGRESPLDLNCDTRYVIFENTAVKKGLDPDSTKPVDIMYNGKKVKKFVKLDDAIVNQVIADEMRVCWYEFGEGKLDVFPNNEDKISWSDTDICVICSDITFKNVRGQTYTGLVDYIKTAVIINQKMTYQQYFDSASNSSLASWSDIFANSPSNYLTISSDDSYVVFFKKEYDKISRQITSKTFWTQDPFSKPVSNAYYVHIVKKSDLNKWCSIVPS